MTSEEIRDFTQRITESNRTELIVVLFDIFNVYLNEARDAFSACDRDRLKGAVRNASAVLSHLKSDLDFKYSQSGNLYALYDYCDRCLSKVFFSADDKGLTEADQVMSSLRESFVKLAESDKSMPLMRNTQRITFGITYGRNDVNGIQESYDVARGFLA